LLSYVASIPLSSRSLARLSELIRARRAKLGGRWRRLPAYEQALMTLAHLRNGDTLARLVAGFAVLVSRVWRYLRGDQSARRQSAGLDADCPPGGPTGVRSHRRHADPDRPRRRPEAVLVRENKRHGVNVQILADPAGRLVRASPALPGAVHDLTAARTHGLVDALTRVKRDDLRRQGLSGRRRHHLDPVQKAPQPDRGCRAGSQSTDTTRRSALWANAPLPPPRHGKSHQAALQPPSLDQDRPSCTRPPAPRRRPLPTMNMAQ
jgi:Helix-turn-helix of DDE superfamily endonuclease